MTSVAVHDTPSLLDVVSTKPMTIEEIAEATGHEVHPGAQAAAELAD